MKEFLDSFNDFCKTYEFNETEFIRKTPAGPNHPSYGLKHSKETKKILSDLKKGAIFSEEHRKKLRESAKITKNFLGKKHSGESKIRMSQSAKNRKNRTKLRCSCVICQQEISNNHLGHHYKKHQ